MLPTNSLASALAAYTKIPDVPLIQVVDAVEGVRSLFTLGEQVRATVTSQLPTGRFAVLVKDQLLDLNLPRNTQPGQTLDLRVLSNSPRLTFLLARNPQPATTQSDDAPQGEGSAVVEVSETGQFVGQLLQERAERPSQPADASLVSRATLLSALGGRTLDPRQLAERLQQAVSESGLFYESHLEEWLAGKRPLVQLLNEPQSRLAPDDTAARAQAGAREEPVRAGPARPAAARGESAGVNDREADHADPDVAAADTPDGHPLEQMPSAMRQLVQEQLQLLDQRQIVWRGEVWPGQPMQWEIRDDRTPHSVDERTPQRWTTRIDLDLPVLGAVSAFVTLTGQYEVEVTLAAQSPETVQRLNAASQRLQGQLEAAGLQLINQQVLRSD